MHTNYYNFTLKLVQVMHIYKYFFIIFAVWFWISCPKFIYVKRAHAKPILFLTFKPKKITLRNFSPTLPKLLMILQYGSSKQFGLVTLPDKCALDLTYSDP